MTYEELINPSDKILAKKEYYKRYIKTNREHLCDFKTFYKIIWKLENVYIRK